ncbi:MAG: hypothetical protein HFH68_09490 [Lachnospiraceae bacterium]|nr:hypothetical protein [Lachnospiraceae bacterium]
MNYFEPADISIYIQGKGTVLKEKSLIAYNETSGKILAYGNEAAHMAENITDSIKIISPLCRGTVADYMAAVKLFTFLLDKTWGKRLLRKPPAAVCVPGNITMTGKKAVEDTLYQAGAGKVLVSVLPLAQLLEEIPRLSADWHKVKTFICIGKDEPWNYIKEQLSEIASYAEHEGISAVDIVKVFQEMYR